MNNKVANCKARQALLIHPIERAVKYIHTPAAPLTKSCPRIAAITIDAHESVTRTFEHEPVTMIAFSIWAERILSLRNSSDGDDQM